MSFGLRGSRGVADDPAAGVRADAESGQVASVGSGMVGAVPAVAQVFGVCGKQDRGFQFPGVHVVVVAAGDCGDGAGFGPVFAAGVQTDSDRSLGVVGLLDDVGQDGVAAMGVDHQQTPGTLRGDGFGDVFDDVAQGDGTDADGAGERGVFVRAAEGNGRELKDVVVRVDRGSDGGSDEGVGSQRQKGAVLLE